MCFIDMSLRNLGEDPVDVAASLSVFIKQKDFSVVQRQHQISQPTNITAVILNEARALIRDIMKS